MSGLQCDVGQNLSEHVDTFEGCIFAHRPRSNFERIDTVPDAIECQAKRVTNE